MAAAVAAPPAAADAANVPDRGVLHSGPGPRSLTFSSDICGQATDFVITDFGSQLFIIITQSAKIGSLIEGTMTESVESGMRTYDVKVLFGDRGAEHYRSYARALIELITSGSSKALLLGIALKEHSTEGFRKIIGELRERIVAVSPPQGDDEDDDDLLPRRQMEDLSVS
eukprot:TRINITY_DN35078_c0_g1_i1.p2 TRINITY_DN35078_c0_g1~~TRINITY_DN35078_c0_g1_i1.p2  ORF type:complete len:170 (-),score=38.99 TRINITY_DN35078_c0_g1_i1:161-670(-)